MAKKFLDEEGLKVLWAQIKAQHNQHQTDLVETLADYATIEEMNKAIDEALAETAGALKFIGVVDSLDSVEEPHNGDIALVGSAEYVYVETKSEGEPDEEGNPTEVVTGEWRLIGDESAYETKANAEANKKETDGRLDALEGAINGKENEPGLESRLDTLETLINGNPDAEEDEDKEGLKDKVNSLEELLNNLDVEINGNPNAEEGADDKEGLKDRLDAVEKELEAINEEIESKEPLALTETEIKAICI